MEGLENGIDRQQLRVCTALMVFHYDPVMHH